MSRAPQQWLPPSLAHCFDPPDGHTGEFGWICGFSADALFMSEIANRFTRQTDAQRASEGRLSLALMLDPINPQITLDDAPGVAHLPLRDGGPRPFRLMHAKLALLAYRRTDEGASDGAWLLRLVVSTGNWTIQTLESSLDLAWRIDLPGTGLEQDRQACADVRAAWELFRHLFDSYDDSLLRAEKDLSRSIVATSWIEACVRRARGTPRLFDNRRRSLKAGVLERVKAKGAVRRNYLAMGSGFYESVKDGKGLLIPQQIVKELKAEGLLTKTPKGLDIVVNPHGCQGIAASMHQLNEAGFTVRPAACPKVLGDGQRSLHAKFLFSANGFDRKADGKGERCSSAWLYLGSGNLTSAGFLGKAGRNTGNLETGIVIFPDDLLWKSAGKGEEMRELGNRLPMQPGDGTILTSANPPAAGEAWECPDDSYIAPPIAYLEWDEEARLLHIPGGSDGGDIQVECGGSCCERVAKSFLWPQERPRMVRIRWTGSGTRHSALLPVVDRYGRIAAAPLRAIGLDEAWQRLEEFPMPMEPDDEGEGEGGHDGQDVPPPDRNAAARGAAGSTPIRRMMELVESVALRQTALDERDWLPWCSRLEQTLSQARGSDAVSTFREDLRLNPLHPLRNAAFRPDFALDGTTMAGRIYEATLERIEADWGVAALAGLGSVR